jgi:hypothetical protein
MTEATKTLDGDKFTENDVLLADGIEDRDTSAENWCVFDRIDVSGDTNNGFCAEKHILCIPSIACDAIHCFVLTHLEEPTLT